MRKILLRPTQTVILFFLLSAPLFSVAQKHTISGQIYDRQNEESIPFANIVLFNHDYDRTAGGAVSDDEGLFELDKIKAGTYNLVISFIGYATDTLSAITVSDQQAHLDLGKINLHPAVVTLEEINIQGQADQVSTEIDRKKYNAQAFETAKGGTALDLLNKLPSVSVGPDGNVSVRGTTDFMVYLNGKPTQLEPDVLLGQLSADAIENIELITVPTAKYDAQGKGGIINIITRRKGIEGLSVSANLLTGGSPWGNLTDKYSQVDNNDRRYGGGLNLVYNKNNTTLYGGLFYNRKNVDGDRVGDARLLQEDGSYYHMVASGERPEWYRTFSANLGADFKLSERSSLSAAYYFGDRKEGRSAFYVYNNFYADVNKNPIPGIPENNEWIYNPNTDNRYGIFNSGNLDYTLKLDDQTSINASVLYEHSSLSRKLDNKVYGFDKPGDRVEDMQVHFKQSDDSPLDGLRVSLDFDKQLDNGSAISFGLQPQLLWHKGTFRFDTLNVEQGEWGSNTEFENAVDLYRGVYAGYGDYKGKSARFEYELGLRLEYTDQTLDMENPNYFNIFDRPAESRYVVRQLNVFPSLHFRWTLADDDHLIISGSRRINRPPTKNMAPFLYRRHYEVYVVGDPALEPEYLNNAELSYEKHIGDQSFTLTGFYRGTENAIFRVNTVYQEENVLIRSYTNAGNTQSLGAELNSNLTIGPSLSMFVGGSLYHYRVAGDIFGYKENNQSTNWSLKSNMNWKATNSLKLSADFDFKSATVTAQGANDLFYMVNAAVTYAPEHLKSWSFALRGIDLLASNITGLYTRAYDREGVQIFYQEVQYNRYGPIVEIGINYSFNSAKNKKRKAKKTFGDEQF